METDQAHKSLDTTTVSDEPAGMGIIEEEAYCGNHNDVADQENPDDNVEETPAHDVQTSALHSTTTPIESNERLTNQLDYHDVIQHLEEKNESLRSERDQLVHDKEYVIRQATAVLAKNETLENDNMRLRAQILEMKKPPGQTHNDGEYKNWLESLNAKIELWAASVFKGKNKMSNQDEQEITDVITQLDPKTQLFQCLADLNLSIKSVVDDPRTRVPLARHIIAIFLKEYVFAPFCFGMDRKPSDMLHGMAKSTRIAGIWPLLFDYTNVTEGSNFANVLQFRQFMGRAVIETVKGQEATEREFVVDQLESVLQHLRPAKNQLIRAKLESYVDEAIELANKMTIERAWFRCWLAPSGGTFREGNMAVPPDQTGKVLFCTFPGFGKIILGPGTGAPVFANLVESTVELESHFMS